MCTQIKEKEEKGAEEEPISLIKKRITQWRRKEERGKTFVQKSI